MTSNGRLFHRREAAMENILSRRQWWTDIDEVEASTSDGSP